MASPLGGQSLRLWLSAKRPFARRIASTELAVTGDWSKRTRG